MTTVPMYEAKNKLPLFVHQAEETGPVFISRRNKTVGVLLSFDEYNRLLSNGLVFKDNDAANAFWEKQGYTLRTNLNYRNKSLNQAVPQGE